MKIVLVQTAIADYRDSFISKLTETASKHGDKLSVIAGDQYFEATTRTSDFVASRSEYIPARNIFFLNRRLLIQSYPFLDVLNADVVICELNPRIVNTWFLILLRRILRRKVVTWGHAWPRKGPSASSDKIRRLIRNSADALVLYTEKQKEDLISSGFHRPIHVAPNSLYSQADFKNLYCAQSESIIYVGRLVASKKVSALLNGAAAFLREHVSVTLEIVGSGDELDNLKVLARTLGIDRRVVFHGHISRLPQLEEIYSRSFVSVSPGYVGLSITQSFSFGVPMLISETEPHSPEIEAFVPGFNGSYFDGDDPAALSAVLAEYYRNRDTMKQRSHKILADCAERYSVENMVRGFYESART